jgi:hypothetical protein
MSKRVLLFVAALALAAAAPGVARAQRKTGQETYEDKVKAKHFDFDDDVVETDTVSPEGFPINSKIPPKFESLIKMRTSFKSELLKSAEDR